LHTYPLYLHRQTIKHYNYDARRSNYLLMSPLRQKDGRPQRN
jgi:hypothetical protein